MKKPKAFLIMAALSLHGYASTIETPIPDVFSLGTLTTDTGNPNRFSEGTFTFLSPILDFREYKISVDFDRGGVDTMPDMDAYTSAGAFFNIAPKLIYEGQTKYSVSGAIGTESNLIALRFYILSGGGHDSAFINFPETISITKLTEIQDPPVELPPPPVDIPDTGSTASLLGIGAIGLAGLKRRFA